MNFNINKFEFPTLDLAWEGINEYLANNEPDILKKGGGIYSSEILMYDTFIYVYKAKVRDDFNFGRILGYRNKKWSKLINNYVNLNYLDFVKAEVMGREKTRSKHYSYSFHFDNSHSSGKDCLISLTFCRRKQQENPYVIYNTRASEATSRMIFDFLLIQRIVEYVYGNEQTVEVLLYIPFVYINIERYIVYMGHKGRNKAVKVNGEPNRYQQKLLAKYDEFMAKPIEQIKFRVHKRAALQIKKDKDGNPISGVKDLFAKDLTFPYNKKKRPLEIAKLDKDL